MKVIESLLTRNPCYAKNLKRDDPRYTSFQDNGPKGLMLHSIGCPQPNAEVLVRSWNRETYDGACVHAFIDGNTGVVYQTLPWRYRGWHCGDDANNTHIGVEMCEPGCIKYTGSASFACSDLEEARAVAKRTYDSAVELFATLCWKYDLDPLADGVILSHKEGHARGIASNHGDPEHLWTQLGLPYTMDSFRKEVAAWVNKDIDWSADAVAWATKNGVMLGGTDGDLMLDEPLTRRQFCVMLKRYHDAFDK